MQLGLAAADPAIVRRNAFCCVSEQLVFNTVTARSEVCILRICQAGSTQIFSIACTKKDENENITKTYIYTGNILV